MSKTDNDHHQVAVAQEVPEATVQDLHVTLPSQPLHLFAHFFTCPRGTKLELQQLTVFYGSPVGECHSTSSLHHYLISAYEKYTVECG